MPRRRTGRPPGRPTELTDASNFRLFLSEGDRRRLEQAAARSGISRAAIIRNLIRRGLPFDPFASALPPPAPAPPPADQSVILRVTIAPGQYAHLKAIAAKNDITVAQLVRAALREARLLPPLVDRGLSQDGPVTRYSQNPGDRRDDD